MKSKIILLTTCIALSPMISYASDTLFGSLGDLVVKGRNALRTSIPTNVQALEADGGNFRLYSWTPSDNKNLTCFMVAGTQKGGAACYPKGQ